MLSSVILKCQVTKIVMTSGSQSEFLSVSLMSHIYRIVFVDVFARKLLKVFKIVKNFQYWQNGQKMSKLS